ARRLARRLAYGVMIRPTGVPLSTRTFLGAPPTPRFGVSEAKEINPRAKARRKRKGIVQDGVIRTELTHDASCAGLTRASILFAKSFYEDGWIAGSSPAMTAVLRFAPRSATNTCAK